MSPNEKRHSKFADARAQVAVLEAGETLLIPAGWWWYSVALEPCASIQQCFFNRSNWRAVIEDFESKMDLREDQQQTQQQQITCHAIVRWIPFGITRQHWNDAGKIRVAPAQG